MPTALITGVSGQDGSYLAEFLLCRGYEVWGTTSGSPGSRAQAPAIRILQGDVTDAQFLRRALHESQPDEIYNLAGVSSVGRSFAEAELTARVNGLSLLQLLEVIRRERLESVRVYQASSSEMFGHAKVAMQSESTPLKPCSPYGLAKAFAHQTCAVYRDSYGMWIASGILFNHESPRRSTQFVTRKISQGVARIALGLADHLVLGSLDPTRDWGFAGDYVRAMWLMLQGPAPRDYVIATGVGHSVGDFVCEALISAGLEPDTERYVRFDPKLLRPNEVRSLVGDSARAQSELGWEPQVQFTDLVSLMVQADLRRLSTQSASDSCA
jgi:GDPmannose 4,6-dehydratase